MGVGKVVVLGVCLLASSSFRRGTLRAAKQGTDTASPPTKEALGTKAPLSVDDSKQPQEAPAAGPEAEPDDRKEDKKKEQSRRGSIVVAPLPIVSPADTFTWSMGIGEAF
jgi:hypothetical protein